MRSYPRLWRRKRYEPLRKAPPSLGKARRPSPAKPVNVRRRPNSQMTLKALFAGLSRLDRQLRSSNKTNKQLLAMARTPKKMHELQAELRVPAIRTA